MLFCLSVLCVCKGHSIRAYLDTIQITKDTAFKGHKSYHNYFFFYSLQRLLDAEVSQIHVL